MALNNDDLEKLAVFIKKASSASCAEACVYKNNSDHDKQHEVLERWIEIDIARRERNEKIKATVLGGTILAVLGGIGSGALAVMNYLKDHLK